MPTAIEFNNISKIYRLGLVSTGTLAHDLKRWWTMNIRGKEDPYLTIGETNDRSTKGDSEYVWALKDIDFKVEQGDVVGIIGKNGAGKSTLLKILSKVTAPTTGTIRARGRIGSLLEVGTGFHPEMTGRENIYMNGAILGMTKAEITKKLDEIVDFSGCERYIDTPVKRYSSGMMVRLGFAVAAHLDPEILVVDEVLAVGDAEFQKKAIGKMQDVSRGEGRTVLFVSHNMTSVRALCHTGILLSNGIIDSIGQIDEIVDKYIATNKVELSGFAIVDNKNRKDHDRLLEFEFISVHLLNNPLKVSCEEPLRFEFEIVRNTESIKDVQIGILISNTTGNRVGSCYTQKIHITDNITHKIRVIINNHNLAKGRYSVNFALSSCDYVASFRDYDGISGTIAFEVNYVDEKYCTPFSMWPSVLGDTCYLNSEIETIY